MEEELKQMQKHMMMAKQSNPSQDLSQFQQQYTEKVGKMDKLRGAMNAQRDMLLKMGLLPARAANNANGNNNKPAEAQAVNLTRMPSTGGQNRTPTNVSFLCIIVCVN